MLALSRRMVGSSKESTTSYASSAIVILALLAGQLLLPTLFSLPPKLEQEETPLGSVVQVPSAFHGRNVERLEVPFDSVSEDLARMETFNSQEAPAELDAPAKQRTAWQCKKVADSSLMGAIAIAMLVGLIAAYTDIQEIAEARDSEKVEETTLTEGDCAEKVEETTEIAQEIAEARDSEKVEEPTLTEGDRTEKVEETTGGDVTEKVKGFPGFSWPMFASAAVCIVGIYVAGYAAGDAGVIAPPGTDVWAASLLVAFIMLGSAFMQDDYCSFLHELDSQECA